jgi:predicted nucleotidyltransferase
LSSSVLVWPDRDAVDRAVRRWAGSQAAGHPELRRLGYFGSYARGDWGVGSDLDLVAIVGESALLFDRRAAAWDLAELPVPAELLVYTEAEWQRLVAQGGRFARTLQTETVWVYPATE